MRCSVCESPNAKYFLNVNQRDYWRCNMCEATFLEPTQRPNADAELAVYRLHDNTPENMGYKQFLARLIDPLIEYLPAAQKGLDYGCGPGPVLASMLRAAGHSMEVFDPFFFNHPEVLANTYDFVTCTEVFEHFHNPAEELKKLNHLLKPGGLLAVMTSFQTDDNHFANWYYRRDPTHVVFYRESTFHYLAQQYQYTCKIPCQNVVFLQKPKTQIAIKPVSSSV
jgi:SAM-dependent methyltransferase